MTMWTHLSNHGGWTTVKLWKLAAWWNWFECSTKLCSEETKLWWSGWFRFGFSATTHKLSRLHSNGRYQKETSCKEVQHPKRILVASTKKLSNQRKGKKKALPPVTQQSDTSDTEPSDSEPSDKEDEEEDIVDAGVSDEEQDDPQDPEEDNGFDYDDDEDDEEDVDSLTATATPRCNVTTPRVSTIQALQTLRDHRRRHQT